MGKHVSDQELIGMKQKNGRLTAIGPVKRIINSKGKVDRYVNCKCECGNEKLVRANLFLKEECSSCGCLAKENHQRLGQGRKDGTIKSRGNTIHGGKGTRIYSVWANMNNRCTYECCDNYKHYGGRGIQVCYDWSNKNPYGFENFRSWAYYNGYDDTKDLDRANTNDGYNPRNCRFISHRQNVNNVRSNINITYGDQTHTLAEWSEMTGINYNTLKNRYHDGWKPEDILTVPNLGQSETLNDYKNKHGAIRPVLFLENDLPY